MNESKGYFSSGAPLTEVLKKRLQETTTKQKRNKKRTKNKPNKRWKTQNNNA